MSALVDWVTKAAADRDWKKVGLVCGTVVVAILVGHQYMRCGIAEKSWPETTTRKKVKLMEHEKEVMMMLPAITTLTSYKANQTPETALRKKIAELIQVNPWLCGRILKNAANGFHLAHPGAADIAENVEHVLKEHFQVVMDFELPENLPYEELGKVLAPFQVDNGNNSVNKPDALLFRITLLKIKGRDKIALVVSMSHVIADGYTYYKIMGMLNNTTPVSALSATRAEDYRGEVAKLVGKPFLDWINSPLVVAGMIGCTLFRGPIKVFIVKVDNEWLAQQKAAYQAELKKRNTSDGAETPVPFVSTNDILVAWQSRMSGCDLALMSINCRNRVPAFTEQMAGNYESNLCYSCPADCHSAGAIRKSLQNFRSASDKMPGVLQTLIFNASMTSNWCSFYEQVEISALEDNATCTYLRHLPVADPVHLTFLAEGAVFFKMDASTTGMMLATRRLTAQTIEASGVGKVCRAL